MTGIYLHIPFCKQACHYCDFHFSTSLKHRDALLGAIHQELAMRAPEAKGQPVHSIYFGGGTPSLLHPDEIDSIIQQVKQLYEVSPDAEVTLEANPDDLDGNRMAALAQTGVNRLSLGIQSFRDEELQWMNRAHSARQAHQVLEAVAVTFENYSIDLIYGIPGSSPETWEQTLQTALGYAPPHISAYALTVEPRTALKAMIDKGKSPDVDDERAESDFRRMLEVLEAAGYVHYETSNFGQPGAFAVNNTAYWQGKPYIGIGPSAHSYNGRHRRWNVANNLRYLRAIEAGEPFFEKETLSTRDRYNEAVMTGLRTMWGVSLEGIRTAFGPRYEDYLLMQAEPYLERHLLYRDGDSIHTSRAGKFLSDGIASDLFMVTLDR
ncbi:radical SAM family heme chaperone HemW [Robiginitalea sediminis]|uniref:radical SAM family heme chaperone HemW n=1 Tax=Robiginitalea sediminis TaxID=1982593 RepID=UPI000B4BA367|nr:radical SAM family heme chaperone HemW [Robiginitalea sediminis]